MEGIKRKTSFLVFLSALCRKVKIKIVQVIHQILFPIIQTILNLTYY